MAGYKRAPPGLRPDDALTTAGHGQPRLSGSSQLTLNDLWAREMALTPDEINAIAAACAKATEARFDAAWKTNLELIMGINISDEDERREVRKDMEWLRESRIGISLKEAEADHIWVRRLRLAVERAIWRVGYAVVVAAIGGVLWLAGVGWRPEILK